MPAEPFSVLNAQQPGPQGAMQISLEAHCDLLGTQLADKLTPIHYNLASGFEMEGLALNETFA